MFSAKHFKDIYVVIVVTVSAKTVLKNVKQVVVAKSASQKARWKIWSKWKPKKRKAQWESTSGDSEVNGKLVEY